MGTYTHCVNLNSDTTWTNLSLHFKYTYYGELLSHLSTVFSSLKGDWLIKIDLWPSNVSPSWILKLYQMEPLWSCIFQIVLLPTASSGEYATTTVRAGCFQKPLEVGTVLLAPQHFQWRRDCTSKTWFQFIHCKRDKDFADYVGQDQQRLQHQHLVVVVCAPAFDLNSFSTTERNEYLSVFHCLYLKLETDYHRRKH